jgi:hypothetical protein
MKRARFLLIAVLLTVLDVAGVVCYGWPVWRDWPEDIWGHGFLVLLAALGATSLANVWAQTVPGPDAPRVTQSVRCWKSAGPIRVQARGQTDV